MDNEKKRNYVSGDVIRASLRFGKMGSDVYEFNKHIKSEFKPYYNDECVNNESDIQSFYAKRLSFMMEELSEISNAMTRNNVADIADGLVDLVYFALGTMVLMDMPITKLWQAVHNSNMTKIGGISKRGIEGDAQKSDSYIAPDIMSILNTERKEAINNEERDN